MSEYNKFSERYLKLKELTNNQDYIGSLTKKELENLINDVKQTQQEYKNLELIVKRDSNSLYGTAASIYFSLVDFDCAEDITSTGRHYAMLVDVNINLFFVNWGDSELKIIQEFYPQASKLIKFSNYVKDSKNDICVYGDTDSRYMDIGKIYSLIEGVELPKFTESGNEELSNFVLFLQKNFIDNLIHKCISEDLIYRNGNQGYLKMTHEVTTRKCVFQAKKKYIMSLVYKDGKLLKTPSLKIVGVELRKGELNKRIKKIIRRLIEKYMLENCDIETLRVETLKLIKYIKMRKEKDFICRISSVSNLKEITKSEETGRYVSTKKHIQMQMALSWLNFIEENKLQNTYKPPFEGQKMYFYYTLDNNVFAIPDDVNINNIVNAPEPDYNKMLNQVLLKPLLKYLYDENKISDKDIENFLLNVKMLNNFFD